MRVVLHCPCAMTSLVRGCAQFRAQVVETFNTSQMPQTVQKQPQRKRVRKRKRRNVSTSSSSSSDSDSGSGQSSSSSRPASVSKKKAGKAPAKLTPAVEPSDSSSDAEYSDSSDSDGRTIPAPKLSKSGAGQQSEQQNASSSSPNEPRERSPGLIHPASPIPELFPLPDTEEGRLEEERLRERFRKLWMSSMADSFADDLNEIRQVCSLSFLSE